MKVPFIDNPYIQAADVPGAMKTHDVEYHAIASANWPATFPYTPKSQFAMAYTADSILLHFLSEEQDLRAFVREDNGDVWTDACVEMFLAPDGDDHYYNLECNCIGKLLMGFGTGRHDRQRAPYELLQRIQRWTSLSPLSSSTDLERQKELPTPWQLALVVPLTAFYAHHIHSFDTLHPRANFYKCGGSGQYEHYLSFAPIDTPTPDFHRPDFFTQLEV